MPERAISSVERPRTERPSCRMSPAVIGATPMIARSVDDFPAPFGPISPTISPFATSKLSRRTAGTAP